MSRAKTNGVLVEVETEYLPERSDPERNTYYFAYRVRITNEGKETVQLMSRHWIITNADGRREEVEGPGVVGQQPVLNPGQAYEYTSFCPLNTPMGTMHGTYQMMTDDGESFDAEIAPFTLALDEVTFH